MDSSSGGTTSNSSGPFNSSSEVDQRLLLIDQKKHKRMVSNRESARRSRLRKQNHLNELTAQAAWLRIENHETFTSLTLTTRACSNVEAENEVLRARLVELSQRLESLNNMVVLFEALMARDQMLAGFDDPGCILSHPGRAVGNVGFMY